MKVQLQQSDFVRLTVTAHSHNFRTREDDPKVRWYQFYKGDELVGVVNTKGGMPGTYYLYTDTGYTLRFNPDTDPVDVEVIYI